REANEGPSTLPRGTGRKHGCGRFERLGADSDLNHGREQSSSSPANSPSPRRRPPPYSPSRRTRNKASARPPWSFQIARECWKLEKRIGAPCDTRTARTAAFLRISLELQT